MISTVISRLIILLFGVLYPAYASYKAVKNKDVRSHLQWMMYWIVFALFTCIETFSDIFISFWMPFYYEIKILFVLWLLSPATKGSSLLYRRFVHPQLVQREQDIDELIEKAKEQGYSTMLLLGSRGLSYATSVVLQTAIKAQEAIVAHKNHDLEAVRSTLNRPDGIALAWVDTDSDSDHLPEDPFPPFSPAPFVGTGDSLDMDNNVYGGNLCPHDEELSPSPHPVPAKAPRTSVKNRSRHTAQEAVITHQNRDIEAIRSTLNRPDGIAPAWVDTDSDSDHLPEMPEDPFPPAPFVGIGDSLDMDNNVYGVNLCPHDEETCLSPRQIPAKTPRTSIKNRSRHTAQEAIVTLKNRDIEAIRSTLNRPDGIAPAWVDTDSDSDHLPEMPEDPFHPAPFVGTGDSLDMDNNVYGVNLCPHEEEICLSLRPVAAKAPRTSIKNRSRNTAQEAIVTLKNRDIEAIRSTLNRPDGIAPAWVDMDSDSDHLPEMPEDPFPPFSPAPFVGTGDSLDMDNNVYVGNLGPHDEETCLSPRPVAAKAPRTYIKNRSRNTARTTDSTGPTRRSSRASKNANKN